MKKSKILAIILTLSIIMVGCKSDVEQVGQSSESKSAINSEYIHLTMVKPKTINPIINKDKSVGYVMNLIYDGLFTIDENYDVVPQLVEEYGISADGMSMSFKLKEAKWHNGSEVTSEDVRFTVGFIQSNPESPYAPFVENINSVSIINNKEFTMNFKSKYSFSIDTLVFPIVSKNNLASSNKGESQDYKNNLIGNGPYKIEKYREREGMSLSVNKEYYEDQPSTMRDIEVGIVPDEEAKVSMLMALESDISNVSLNDLSKFYEKEFNITKYEGREYESIIFNYENPLLKDINFRKAIAHSIDRGKILEEGYMGDATLVNFPLNSKSKYYDKDLKPLQYNKETAKKYLEKVKPIDNGASQDELEENQQKQEKNKNDNNQQANEEKGKNKQDKSSEGMKSIISNLNLKIVVNKENSERVKTAHLISETLKSIGIKSTVDQLVGEELDKALNEKKYDLAIVGWELSSIPDAKSIIQSSGYSDEKLESYIVSLENATSQDQIDQIYKSIQKHIRDKVAFISLVIRDEYLVSNRRIEGKKLPNEFDVYRGMSNLNIKNKE